mmetsp:Transcript_8287/g.20880  ORF Transcript_8287/g.20880 Transcript_8287/m.20880 type:complete len:233 (-) Transcript_8287:1070-1768(-)
MRLSFFMSVRSSSSRAFNSSAALDAASAFSTRSFSWLAAFSAAPTATSSACFSVRRSSMACSISPRARMASCSLVSSSVRLLFCSSDCAVSCSNLDCSCVRRDASSALASFSWVVTSCTCASAASLFVRSFTMSARRETSCFSSCSARAFSFACASCALSSSCSMYWNRTFVSLWLISVCCLKAVKSPVTLASCTSFCCIERCILSIFWFRPATSSACCALTRSSSSWSSFS